ncbi:undecaprenyl-diphosphatase [Herbihabitans rhizosphaerae]|uniref:Undecaprenyl-diphosphatase n=1 Tax=Herbihabitans rhizosphaerae TaxID=1872711 RepID=A0A4Q7L4A6_9PSEU|nr:undecaprenyl-diphosphate phosphatase [Herbihabitans rhizosphaerae]RZS43610.1 undecaprenyl-diphosphatase [Herbihabitans rhizosphaerae]
MGWLEALVLGLVQGLTEFLPISSSAHLRITAAFAGWGDPGAAFTAVTQIGTETAVVIYFRKDLLRFIKGFFRTLASPKKWMADQDSKMAWLLIIGTLPIAVLGLLFEDEISHAFRDLRLIAFTLILFGVLLGIADKIGAKQRKLDDLTPPHGLAYGFAQAMALIPGVSRSGGTTTAGLLMGYRRESAAEYAFLLAMPAVFASGFYKLTDIGGDNSPPWGPTIFATVISFFVGYAVIAWLMKYIKTRTFTPFVIYRVALGLALLLLVMFGALDPNAGPVV